MVAPIQAGGLAPLDCPGIHQTSGSFTLPIYPIGGETPKKSPSALGQPGGGGQGGVLVATAPTWGWGIDPHSGLSPVDMHQVRNGSSHHHPGGFFGLPDQRGGDYLRGEPVGFQFGAGCPGRADAIGYHLGGA